jgi:uncharacterized membrane protein
MFEFLFKYPAAVFSKGSFVLLGSWPKWVLALLVIACACGLGYAFWRKRTRLKGSFNPARAAVLWGLQSALVATLLLLLWQPAISVTALRPQQNIVAVLVDDSRSMSLADDGNNREQQALSVLNRDLLPNLSRYQVRLYRVTDHLARIPNTNNLHSDGGATQIGSALKQLASEAGTLPIGSVVLLSDGADNAGGIDLDAMTELRRRRLPVNTVGFGKLAIQNDIELERLSVPATALQNSRLQAQIAIHQNGFAGQKTSLIVTSGGRVVAGRDVVLKDGPEQVETVEFNAGPAGVKDLQATLQPLAGEQNRENNRLTHTISVDGTKRRLLYVEGEPRWDYKFIRRAVEDDPAIEVVSMLRTTQTKVYRQGISNPSELLDGFPIKEEDLFDYQGIVLGSIESGYFNPAQQRAIQDFVDRRGGGLLFLGGRAALADGDYNVPPFRDLLPVTLPSRKGTFSRTLVTAELTDEGKRSLVCRIEDDPEKSNDHWEILPYLANYQDPGLPKPGAVVLARMNVNGTRLPLLITENYGRGRSAVFATGGSWRWRMQQPTADTSEETFWRQLLRWTAGTTPSRVTLETANPDLRDNGALVLRAEVRDKENRPTANAEVRATIIGPDGATHSANLQADSTSPGVFTLDWNATSAGSYVAEVIAQANSKELGRSVLPFRRENGTAEAFHREQNRDLLERLAQETGGRYYSASSAKKLPQEISFSEAGISAREIKDLWDMPAIFLAILLLRGSEWLLRRRWGLV